jgi:hypothetical protein
MWFCTFFDHNHRVLRTATGAESPEQAVLQGQAILSGHGGYELIDADSDRVSAAAVDSTRGFTIEPDHI